MLRITKDTNGKQTILKVEGKLVAPWLRELETCWRSSAGDASVVLDLRSVTFVSPEAKELLRTIHRSGAKLITTGILMNALVEELEIGLAGRGK